MAASREYSIRPATELDAKPVRMLISNAGSGSVQLVAIDEHQRVIGAAAAAQACRLHPLKGPGVFVHVIPPWRRCGIAKSLLTRLEQAVFDTGAKALYAASRVDVGSKEFDQWTRLGFQSIETVEEHALPVDQIEARLGPLVDRMRAHGKIPANARVVKLYQANAAEVLKFHVDHMGGDRNELMRKLRGQGPNPFLPRQSRVLLVDGRVKGCLLASRAERKAIVVDANIVEPDLRGGWANAWLKLEAFRGAPPGVIEFQFTSFDHYTDTRSFTKKLGGRTIRATALMYRPIAGAAIG